MVNLGCPLTMIQEVVVAQAEEDTMVEATEVVMEAGTMAEEPEATDLEEMSGTGGMIPISGAGDLAGGATLIPIRPPAAAEVKVVLKEVWGRAAMSQMSIEVSTAK